MLPLAPGLERPSTVLCLGAHSDDIEIGCGGSMLELLSRHAEVNVVWVVFGCDQTREAEARSSSARFLTRALDHRVVVHHFRDGYFPFVGGEIKEMFEGLKREASPDLIFTHSRNDRHQDHRVISDLTWQTFRDHLILEYEIPKYDGDLGRPNCYVPLSGSHCQSKIQHLLTAFLSQREKPWFTEDTFRALMRLRGVECGAPSGFAEAFYAHKFVIGTPSSR